MALGHRRGQHQPGKARTLHELGQLVRQQRRGRVARLDLQAEPGLAAGGQHAVLHADDVVRVGVVVHQPDHERRTAAQVARGRIRLVVQLGDGGEHARARGLHHRRLVVDDPRHRLERDFCPLGDVLDGRPAHLCGCLLVHAAHDAAITVRPGVPPAGRRDGRAGHRTGCTGSRAPSVRRTPTGSRRAASAPRTPAGRSRHRQSP